MISTTLMTSFLIVALLQMYFIGKYTSLNQGIFSNKAFAEFVLGALIYLISSFIFILPFLWLGLAPIYYAILIISKDFLTIVFLLARRDKFKGIKVNYRFLIFLLLSAIIIPIFDQYIFPNIFTSDPFIKKRGYDVWYIFINSLSTISLTEINNFSKIVISPIISIIIYSIVTSIFLMFSKRDNSLDYFISLILTIGLLILFNYSSSFNDSLSIFMLLFLIVPSYNLIIYSRRRYGSVFAIGTFVTFGLNINMFWPLLVLSLSISSIYIVLRKPKASLFVFQLLSPCIIISTFFVIEYSAFLGWTLIVFGLFSYLSIFLFGRVKTIESANSILTKISYWIPFIIIISILITAITYWFTYKEISPSVLLENNFIYDFKSSFLNSLIKGAYFGVAVFILAYSLYWVIKKEKSIKWKLLINISAMAILIGFNPTFHIILITDGYDISYRYMSIIPFIPPIIASAGYLRSNLIKK